MTNEQPKYEPINDSPRVHRILCELQLCQYALNKIGVTQTIDEAAYIATHAIIHTSGWFPSRDCSLEESELDNAVEEWKARGSSRRQPIEAIKDFYCSVCFLRQYKVPCRPEDGAIMRHCPRCNGQKTFIHGSPPLKDCGDTSREECQKHPECKTCKSVNGPNS